MLLWLCTVSSLQLVFCCGFIFVFVCGFVRLSVFYFPGVPINIYVAVDFCYELVKGRTGLGEGSSHTYSFPVIAVAISCS